MGVISIDNGFCKIETVFIFLSSYLQCIPVKHNYNGITAECYFIAKKNFFELPHEIRQRDSSLTFYKNGRHLRLDTRFFYVNGRGDGYYVKFI